MLPLLSFSALFGVMISAHASQNPICNVGGSLDEIEPTEINMVVDDSGSMFLSKSNEQIRLWSYAKYSLEVFAALLRPNDTLNVYLLSSYKKEGGAAKPVVTLYGNSPQGERVDAIRNMTLNGKGTPYGPVQDAYKDLVTSSAPEKWLVIMTDGKFDGVSNEQVSGEVAQYLNEGNVSSRSKLQIAFLSIGDEAPVLTGLERNSNFLPAKAGTPVELIRQMNVFANSIFRQKSAELGADGTLNSDIDMKKIDVFAQGPSVDVQSLSVDGESVEASDSVQVKWSTNPKVSRKGIQYDAIPETLLEGELKSFEDVPNGSLNFDISGYTNAPVIFKTPLVGIGVNLLQDGKPVTSELITGTYEIEPFVADKNCEPIDSDEIGAPELLEVSFEQGDETLGPFKSGETVNLAKGEYDVRMAGVFSDKLSVTSKASIAVQSAIQSSIKMVDSGEYAVSDLADFPPESAGTQFEYVVIEDGIQRPFTQEEWDQIPPDALKVASGNSNIEFEAIKGVDVGQVTVVPRAPNGDVFVADTGEIDFEVFSEYTANGEITESSRASGSINISDDLSTFDKLMNWWKTLGWKLFVLLLLLILLLGYIFKRRFSKRMKRRPSISGTPNQVGTSSEESTGKFRKSGMRSYLPFVADTATLTYVPAGVTGFRPMKLKAGPSKSMIVTNWKQIAEKNNTEINGTPLDEETRRAPQFGPSATITANTPQMTYEMTPNS